MLKTYWHKPTGVAVSEATMMELVRTATYPRSEFEEAIDSGGSVSPLSGAPVVGRKMSWGSR